VIVRSAVVRDDFSFLRRYNTCCRHLHLHLHYL
jgi:hypothetical protein